MSRLHWRERRHRCAKENSLQACAEVQFRARIWNRFPFDGPLNSGTPVTGRGQLPQARSAEAGQDSETAETEIPGDTSHDCGHGPEEQGSEGRGGRSSASPDSDPGPGIPQARVVRLANAKHYVFQSNGEDVQREMNDFIAGLEEGASLVQLPVER